MAGLPMEISSLPGPSWRVQRVALGQTHGRCLEILIKWMAGGPGGCGGLQTGGWINKSMSMKKKKWLKCEYRELEFIS